MYCFRDSDRNADRPIDRLPGDPGYPPGVSESDIDRAAGALPRRRRRRSRMDENLVEVEENEGFSPTDGMFDRIASTPLPLRSRWRYKRR
jgi:hypothetical protein